MATGGTYTIGEVVLLTATNTNSAGTAVDPDTAVFEVRPPNGAEVQTYTYLTDDEVSRSSTGVFVLTLEPETAGRWYYRFEGTGDKKGAEEAHFDIRSSFFS